MKRANPALNTDLAHKAAPVRLALEPLKIISVYLSVSEVTK